jgi:hypothetical protein
MPRLLPPALALLLLAFTLPGPGASQPATIALELHCDHNTGKIASLEEPFFVNQGCWQHLGMHHYFVGRDVVYRLHAGTGFIGGKEQILSPKVEYTATPPPPNQLTQAHWFLETSLDGLVWKKLANVQFQYLNANNANVAFTVADPGESFRFFRVRNPMSATHGLSGYEDGNFWTLHVSVQGPAPAPPLVPQTVEKSCERDILEMVYDSHPCWFGGKHYYDAASWFHHYFLGQAHLTRVQGSVVALYWRAADVGQVVNAIGVEGITSPLTGTLIVQASNDSVQWTTVGTKTIVYGIPNEFDFPLAGGLDAKFVRVSTDRQAHWKATNCWHECAPEHHNEGYLMDSRLTLTGLLP